MRWVRYIFVLLFVLSYRGLSAQEFDLYDFRYYKRFESVEELMKNDDDTPIEEAKFRLNSTFSTRTFDYNLSAVSFARRGEAFYHRSTTINGVEVPFVSLAMAHRLQFAVSRHYGVGEVGLGGELALHIDSVATERTDIGARFVTRNMPYSISVSSAQRMGGGWSLAVDMTARTGRDIFVEGLFGHSVSLSGVARKQISERHSIAFALFVEPSMRSSRLSSTEEAFRLTGDRLYNPAWGYQSGKVRNARIRREIMPTAVVAYEGRLSKSTTASITTSLTAGIERYSALDWFDTNTPLPDNYRYMPSYFNDAEDIFLAVESAWLNNDTRYTQIDFDRLIQTNKLSGGHAIYAISDRVERVVSGNFRAKFSTELDAGTLSYGVEGAMDLRRNYKQMRDLLGAEYIDDLDYYLVDDDAYGNSLRNNLNASDIRVREGGRFGYDYAMRRFDARAFIAYHYSTERLNLNILAKAGYTDISRRGFYRKELFADTSFGASRHIAFAPYLLRAKCDYLLGDYHLVGATLLAEACAVDAENLFLQSQYNNRVVDAPTMRKGYGVELRYLFQRRKVAVSATLFASAMVDDMLVQHLYYDLSGDYADVVVSGVDIVRYGLELEAEYRFATNFRATLAMCAGRYAYADNARITAYSDKSNALILGGVESRTRGLSLGNAPQIAVTAGLSYYNRGWWAVLNGNYMGLRYVEPSMIMRTERVLSNAISPEQREVMLKQERLGDAFTLDLMLSKSLYLDKLSRRVYRSNVNPRFEDRYPRSRLQFRVGVRNLLGAADMVYSARESSRLQRYKLADEYIYTRQATRYIYAYPRTYEVSVAFIF